MTDDGGVLGNLPRSRPGQRSEKRTGRAAKPAGPAKKAAPAGDAAKQTRGATREATKRPASAAGEAAPASRAGDPVGDAVRVVTGVAVTGVRVAGGVAREVVRRLPRP
jgi:hypothetical protein